MTGGPQDRGAARARASSTEGGAEPSPGLMQLTTPGAQVGRLAGAHMPGEAYWVAREPVPLIGMAYPARVDWYALADLGVGRVISLVESPSVDDPTPLTWGCYELQDLYTRPAGPTDPEAERATVLAAADDTVETLAAGRGVAVHCRGGRGRTGTVIGVTLVRLGHDPDRVVRWLDRLHRARGRGGWPESDWQRAVVLGTV